MNKTLSKYEVLCICLALAVTTIAAYEQVRHNGFISLDDNLYVTKNPNITNGLTYQSLIGAFTRPYAAFWHPLTMISHTIDYELFGLNPAGHHITSLILHIANTLLLFLVLKSATACVLQSAFVAAAFALHPLHVESVAWVSERKDVLSTLFWLLTIAAYLRYVKRGDIYSYTLILITFILGLMAKPMLVTLPFVLMLLDYWPLDRLRSGRLLKLILEKVPLLIVSAVWCVITFVVQQRTGTVAGMTMLSLNARVANALTAYLIYLKKTFWPSGLAVSYPYPADAPPIWQTAVCALALLGISAWAVWLGRRYRYLLVGWLWYLGTLVPVIGIVQVGSHSMADRYTYVPLVGIFIMVGWGIADITDKWRYQKAVLITAAAIVLSALLVCTRTQVRYWRDSISIFEHSLKVTNNDNIMMHNNLAYVLKLQGRFDEAIYHYRQVLRINPKYADAHYNLGLALQVKGELDEALDHYKEAARLKANPVDVYNSIAHILLQKGKADEAVDYYRRALEIMPDDAMSHNNLGLVLRTQGSLEEAVDHFRRALQSKPDFVEAYNNLGNALKAQGKFDEAIVSFQYALKLKPDSVEVCNNLAYVLAAHPDPNKRDANRAVELAERAAGLTKYQNAAVLYTLVISYAAAERFDRATETAEKVLELAAASQNTVLADNARRQLEIYKQKISGSRQPN